MAGLGLRHAQRQRRLLSGAERLFTPSDKTQQYLFPVNRFMESFPTVSFTGRCSERGETVRYNYSERPVHTQVHTHRNTPVGAHRYLWYTRTHISYTYKGTHTHAGTCQYTHTYVHTDTHTHIPVLRALNQFLCSKKAEKLTNDKNIV